MVVTLIGRSWIYEDKRIRIDFNSEMRAGAFAADGNGGGLRRQEGADTQKLCSRWENKKRRYRAAHYGHLSVEDGADANELMLPLKMVINDSYVRDIFGTIRSGISTKMNSGEFLPAAGSVPYGCLRDPEEATYEIDAEAAETVKRICSMRVRGAVFE